RSWSMKQLFQLVAQLLVDLFLGLFLGRVFQHFFGAVALGVDAELVLDPLFGGVGGGLFGDVLEAVVVRAAPFGRVAGKVAGAVQRPGGVFQVFAAAQLWGFHADVEVEITGQGVQPALAGDGAFFQFGL